MQFDYKKYINPKTIEPVVEFIKKYKYVLASLLVVGMFYFVIARINSLSGIPLNQEKYDQGILELDRITFDEEAIERIKELQDRDVTVDLDLPGDRENPF